MYNTEASKYLMKLNEQKEIKGNRRIVFDGSKCSVIELTEIEMFKFMLLVKRHYDDIEWGCLNDYYILKNISSGETAVFGATGCDSALGRRIKAGEI